MTILEKANKPIYDDIPSFTGTLVDNEIPYSSGDVSWANAHYFQVTTAPVGGSIIFEISYDGSNYSGVHCEHLNASETGGGYDYIASFSATGIYRVRARCKHVRLRNNGTLSTAVTATGAHVQE